MLRSIYTNTTYNDETAPIGSEDYAKIESVMQKYAEDCRKTGWTNIFYSKDQHGFENSTEYNNLNIIGRNNNSSIVRRKWNTKASS